MFLGLLSSKGVVFWEVSGFMRMCLWARARPCAMFCPWIYKHVPSISSSHRRGLCGRQISPLPLCLPKLSSSLSNFSSLKANKNTFHTSVRELIFFPPSLPSIHAHPLTSPFHFQSIKSRIAPLCVYGATLHEVFSHFCVQGAWVWISFPSYHTSRWCKEVTWLVSVWRCIF